VNPEDPRHGTNAGYVAHAFSDRDYCQPCREAHAEYRRKLWRRRYLRRIDSHFVDATGTTRRIQALLAIGHTHAEISAAAGGAPNMSKNVVCKKQTTIHVDTATAIARAYDQLCMVVPIGWRRDDSRRRAKRLGYLPPLAWNDIDDPDERPSIGDRRVHKDDVDPIAVERAMAGDRVKLTRAERFEVVAGLRRQGMSLLEIEALTVITKPERYIVREQEAS
jgi:hypothetical protein